MLTALTVALVVLALAALALAAWPAPKPRRWSSPPRYWTALHRRPLWRGEWRGWAEAA